MCRGLPTVEWLSVEFGYILTSSEGKERNSFQPRILYNIVACEQIEIERIRKRERGGWEGEREREKRLSIEEKRHS